MPSARENIIAKFIDQMETGTSFVDEHQGSGRGHQAGEGEEQR